jgi:hypothetical protein
MARKGKSTEEIIAFLREAEVRLAQGETAGKQILKEALSGKYWALPTSGRAGPRALAALGVGASGVRGCWPIAFNAASTAESAR